MITRKRIWNNIEEKFVKLLIPYVLSSLENIAKNNNYFRYGFRNLENNPASLTVMKIISDV